VCVQFGFFLTKEQKGAYLDGAVTLFGALTLGVYIKLGIGSIDFELVLQLMEDLNLHLKMHASVPIPALSITDPQSSVNSLTSFDPTAASFSVSGSVNLNGLKTLLVNFVRDCLPNLDGALEYAQAAFDAAKEVYDNLVQAGQEAYQAMLDVGQQALEQFENIGEQLDAAVEQAEAALAAAEAGVRYAEEQAEQMVAQATEYAQEFIDQAEAALTQTRQYFDQAIASAKGAITAAEKAVTDFLAEQAKAAADAAAAAADAIKNAASSAYNGAREFFGWEHHPNPRIRAAWRQVQMQRAMEHWAQSKDERSTLRPTGAQHMRALLGIFDDIAGSLTGAALLMKNALETAVSNSSPHRDRKEGEARISRFVHSSTCLFLRFCCAGTLRRCVRRRAP